RREHQQRAHNLHRSGEVAKPLAKANLRKNLHPRTARVVVELRNSDEDESERQHHPRKPELGDIKPTAFLLSDEPKFGHRVQLTFWSLTSPWWTHCGHRR